MAHGSSLAEHRLDLERRLCVLQHQALERRARRTSEIVFERTKLIERMKSLEKGKNMWNSHQVEDKWGKCGKNNSLEMETWQYCLSDKNHQLTNTAESMLKQAKKQMARATASMASQWRRNQLQLPSHAHESVDNHSTSALHHQSQLPSHAHESVDNHSTSALHHQLQLPSHAHESVDNHSTSALHHQLQLPSHAHESVDNHSTSALHHQLQLSSHAHESVDNHSTSALHHQSQLSSHALESVDNHSTSALHHQLQLPSDAHESVDNHSTSALHHQLQLPSDAHESVDNHSTSALHHQLQLSSHAYESVDNHSTSALHHQLQLPYHAHESVDNHSTSALHHQSQLSSHAHESVDNHSTSALHHQSQLPSHAYESVDNHSTSALHHQLQLPSHAHESVDNHSTSALHHQSQLSSHAHESVDNHSTSALHHQLQLPSHAHESVDNHSTSALHHQLQLPSHAHESIESYSVSGPGQSSLKLFAGHSLKNSLNDDEFDEFTFFNEGSISGGKTSNANDECSDPLKQPAQPTTGKQRAVSIDSAISAVHDDGEFDIDYSDLDLLSLPHASRSSFVRQSKSQKGSKSLYPLSTNTSGGPIFIDSRSRSSSATRTSSLVPAATVDALSPPSASSFPSNKNLLTAPSTTARQASSKSNSSDTGVTGPLQPVSSPSLTNDITHKHRSSVAKLFSGFRKRDKKHPEGGKKQPVLDGKQTTTTTNKMLRFGSTGSATKTDSATATSIPLANDSSDDDEPSVRPATSPELTSAYLLKRAERTRPVTAKQVTIDNIMAEVNEGM